MPPSTPISAFISLIPALFGALLFLVSTLVCHLVEFVLIFSCHLTATAVRTCFGLRRYTGHGHTSEARRTSGTTAGRSVARRGKGRGRGSGRGEGRDSTRRRAKCRRSCGLFSGNRLKRRRTLLRRRDHVTAFDMVNVIVSWFRLHHSAPGKRCDVMSPSYWASHAAEWDRPRNELRTATAQDSESNGEDRNNGRNYQECACMGTKRRSTTCMFPNAMCCDVIPTEALARVLIHIT